MFQEHCSVDVCINRDVMRSRKKNRKNKKKTKHESRDSCSRTAPFAYISSVVLKKHSLLPRAIVNFKKKRRYLVFFLFFFSNIRLQMRFSLLWHVQILHLRRAPETERKHTMICWLGGSAR